MGLQSGTAGLQSGTARRPAARPHTTPRMALSSLSFF
jgi:hypothetical protein